MKTIVVPTDFSPAAENALSFAAQLAKKINASILLLHVYQIPVSMNDMPVLTVSNDELKTNAEVALDRAKETLQKTVPGVEITTDTRLGDVTDELDELCKTREVFAIVVGKHGMSGVERVIFGSTTLSVIRHCSMPIFAVPDKASYHLANAALAVDLQHEATFPEQKIGRLLEELQVNLHIIHVRNKNEEDVSDRLRRVMPGLHPQYHMIDDDHFLHGIQAFIREHNIDLLITIPQKHSMMERLFYRTHTTELVQELDIPILSIKG